MIIGNSRVEGPMIQCEACHTVYAQRKYDSCPHCYLRSIASKAGRKRKRGRPPKEKWIHIGENR